MHSRLSIRCMRWLLRSPSGECGVLVASLGELRSAEPKPRSGGTTAPPPSPWSLRSRAACHCCCGGCCWFAAVPSFDLPPSPPCFAPVVPLPPIAATPTGEAGLPARGGDAAPPACCSTVATGDHAFASRGTTPLPLQCSAAMHGNGPAPAGICAEGSPRGCFASTCLEALVCTVRMTGAVSIATCAAPPSGSVERLRAPRPPLEPEGTREMPPGANWLGEAYGGACASLARRRLSNSIAAGCSPLTQRYLEYAYSSSGGHAAIRPPKLDAAR